jgi:tyrosyl-tRNA synthetase
MIDPFTGGLLLNKEKKYKQECFYSLYIKTSIVDEFINSEFSPVSSTLDIEEKIKIWKQISSQIICEDELRNIYNSKNFPICYEAFEPSSRMTLSQGILISFNTNRLIQTGCIFIFWISDLISLLNNKMGGELNKIRTFGNYNIEILKACGMDLRNVKILWSSEEVSKNHKLYWPFVLNIASKIKVEWIKNKIYRKREILSVSQIISSCLQCSDILFLKSDFCQRREQININILTRKCCKIIRNVQKPVFIVNHTLPGFLKHSFGRNNVYSDFIFMEDSTEEVNKKISCAYCPEKTIKENPIFEYIKFLVFAVRTSFIISIPEKFGGGKTIYYSYEEVEKDYVNGIIHPADIKTVFALVVNELLEPVRKHFQTHPEAKKLLDTVRSFIITR